MHSAVKIVCWPVCAGIAALVIFALTFYLRPIATTFWLRRSALRRGGFRKCKIHTTVGEQIVWQGGSGPKLILLHGAGDQASTWYRIAPELKKRFCLLMPDLAGHGNSEPFEGLLSLGTLLTALEELLDATVPDGEMVIVGNSLGAWMAMLYAEKHAKRVKRLVLVDGGPIRHVSEIGLMPKNREEAGRAFDAVLDPSAPRRPNFVLDDLVRVSNSGPISRLLGVGEEDLSKYLLDGKLSNFQMQVDLVWGASDRLVPMGYARKLQSELPHSTLTVIERCGHAPQLERPRELARVLLQILASEPDSNIGAQIAPQKIGSGS